MQVIPNSNRAETSQVRESLLSGFFPSFIYPYSTRTRGEVGRTQNEGHRNTHTRLCLISLRYSFARRTTEGAGVQGEEGASAPASRRAAQACPPGMRACVERYACTNVGVRCAGVSTRCACVCGERYACTDVGVRCAGVSSKCACVCEVYVRRCVDVPTR